MCEWTPPSDTCEGGWLVSWINRKPLSRPCHRHSSTLITSHGTTKSGKALLDISSTARHGAKQIPMHVRRRHAWAEGKNRGTGSEDDSIRLDDAGAYEIRGSKLTSSIENRYITSIASRAPPSTSRPSSDSPRQSEHKSLPTTTKKKNRRGPHIPPTSPKSKNRIEYRI